MSNRSTRFRSRGKLAGLIRDEAQLGTSPNRSNRQRRDSAQGAVDEATYYRARLILGDNLTRPGR